MRSVAVLLDGGYVAKRHVDAHRVPILGADVRALVTRLLAAAPLEGHRLYRVFFYDAPPLAERARNPLTGRVENFGATPQALRGWHLIADLELSEPYAVRLGQPKLQGWKLRDGALKDIARTNRPVAADDVIPNIIQKGVDIKVGLDIAWMASRRIVETLLLVTGDSDMIPAMKHARREGLCVVLATLGQRVYRELRVHADYVLDAPA
jgi:uncharacterized LabA/DUF88 family protein